MIASDSYITTSLYFGGGEKHLFLWPDSIQCSFLASTSWKSIQGYENFHNPGVFFHGTIGHLYGARQNYLFYYYIIPRQFFQIVTCMSFESEQ